MTPSRWRRRRCRCSSRSAAVRRPFFFALRRPAASPSPSPPGSSAARCGSPSPASSQSSSGCCAGQPRLRAHRAADEVRHHLLRSDVADEAAAALVEDAVRAHLLPVVVAEADGEDGDEDARRHGERPEAAAEAEAHGHAVQEAEAEPLVRQHIAAAQVVDEAAGVPRQQQGADEREAHILEGLPEPSLQVAPRRQVERLQLPENQAHEVPGGRRARRVARVARHGRGVARARQRRLRRARAWPVERAARVWDGEEGRGVGGRQEAEPGKSQNGGGEPKTGDRNRGARNPEIGESDRQSEIRGTAPRTKEDVIEVGYHTMRRRRPAVSPGGGSSGARRWSPRGARPWGSARRPG